ncbi:MAG: dehydrogenase [Deltaproteobacteria bacterium]|jgi:NAD(P)-dependent dehydrogenase (short-subunit alcohol dehydrogenase family)|nr:dehydrogenase [Deltaproteobacteria bacterium]
MSKRLEDRVAIVTGAAQGIGASYARALAAEGASITIADRVDGSVLAREIREGGGRVQAVEADVSDPGSVEAMVESTLEAFGRIDILVNNAAIFGSLRAKPFDQIDLDEWDLVMRVNVRGAFQCATAVVPAMRENGHGRIINISSGTIFKGTPYFLHYLSSKGAIWAMTRGLAREVGGDGITVNTIAPGYTASESVLNDESTWNMVREGMNASRAIQRDQLPEDLTGSVVFLASDDSAFITGQCLVVDGGSAVN